MTGGGLNQAVPARPGWLRLISLLVVVGLWQLLSATGVLPPEKLGSPVTIGHTAYTLITTNSPTYGTLQASLLVSAERWGIGLAIGVAIAVLLAIVTGLSLVGEYAFDPTLNAGPGGPVAGLIPLFITWFGIGNIAKILIVRARRALPDVRRHVRGHPRLDPKLGELGRVLGLSRWELVRHVVLPGSLPSAFTGLRLSVIGSLLALLWASRSTPTPESAS